MIYENAKRADQAQRQRRGKHLVLSPRGASDKSCSLGSQPRDRESKRAREKEMEQLHRHIINYNLVYEL